MFLSRRTGFFKADEIQNTLTFGQQEIHVKQSDWYKGIVTVCNLINFATFPKKCFNELTLGNCYIWKL